MALMHKTRIWLKPFQSVLRIKSPQIPPTAHFTCSRDFSSGDRGENDRRGGVRPRSVKPVSELLGGGGKKSSVRKMPAFPQIAFSAGVAKRAEEIRRRKEERFLGEPDHTADPEETRRQGWLPPPDHPLSVSEWRTLSTSVGNPPNFSTYMMNGLRNSSAKIPISKSLLTYVAAETGTLPYKLLLLHLSLCVNAGHDEEVPDIYDIMRGSFPSLDTGASSLFIKSFSRTARWREALNILQEVNKVFNASASNYGVVIAAAMSHGHMNTAWALYDEMIEKGLSSHQETWSALFQGAAEVSEERSEAMPQSDHQDRLLGILHYMRNNQIYPRRDLASQIKTWFESLPGQKWTGHWTKATLQGQCMCCQSKLESIQMTTAEYQQLKEKVLTNIISGQDVFRKTTPEELQRFVTFVKARPAFDLVLDGLNVANANKDKSQQSATLLALVLALQQKGLNVLVLGRKHMLDRTRRWNYRDMLHIQQNAHCFYTDNTSEDDPFLLYATLHSGNHCQFVSRDLMRDHLACLPDDTSKRLFFKWQRGHQLIFTNWDFSQGITFMSILKYDTVVQTSGDSWHIPFDDTEERATHEVPLQWLCLTHKP